MGQTLVVRTDEKAGAGLSLRRPAGQAPSLFALFSGAFSQFERSENHTFSRILAPVFLTFMSNPQTDLKRPLTIFDKTRENRLARRPRRTQEDLGAF